MGATLVLSKHCQERMALRLVTLAEVNETYRNPDYTRPGKAGATNYHKRFGAHKIRVTAVLHRDGSGRVAVKTVTISPPRT